MADQIETNDAAPPLGLEDGEPMEIHRPKPWRNAPELLKEIGVIVIGVMIALGGEQAVEWLHGRHEIHEAREALHGELVRNASMLRTNVLEDQCLLSVLGPRANDPNGPGASDFRLHFAEPDSTVWDAVKSGAVARMRLDEKLAYARFYGDASVHLRVSDRALEPMSRLLGYLSHATPTQAEERLAQEDRLKSQGLLAGKLEYEQGMLAEAKALGAQPLPLSSAERARLEAWCGKAGVPLK